MILISVPAISDFDANFISHPIQASKPLSNPKYSALTTQPKTVKVKNDCIRNTTAVCNLRQIPRRNSVRDKIQSEKNLRKKIFCWKKIVEKENFSEKNLSWMLSWISSAQSKLPLTIRCVASLSGI